MKPYRILTLFALVVLIATTVVPAFAADPNPGSGSADVTVMYANDSGPSTTVLAQYYNPSGGSPAGTRQQQLGPLGSYQFRASDSGLPDNWVGSMVLSASSELAATATIQWTGAPLGDGREADTYTGFGSGSSQMNIPYLVYAPNAQYSVISVQNTEANTTANITMRYYNRNGGLDFTITDQIPALGQKMYDMHVPGAKVPVWSQSSYFQTNGTWTGSVVISTGGSDQKVAAINNNFWPRYNVAYNGGSQGARKLFLPSVERRYTNPNTEPGWLGFSLTTVQNLGTGPTSVTVKYVNKDTGNVDLNIGPITLNAGVAVGCNTRSGGVGCVDRSVFNVLGGSWSGSVIVESTSQDVAAVNFSIRPRDNEAGGYTGAATVFAGTKNFLPEVYQIGGAGNNRTQWSLIRIQNVTNQTANVEVKFVNRDGTTATTRNLTIGGEKSSNFNLRGDDQVNLGGNWTGAVYITSNQQLVAVVENLWGLQRLAAYNSYSR